MMKIQYNGTSLTVDDAKKEAAIIQILFPQKNSLNNRKKWSPGEIEELNRLIVGGATNESIAQKLGRNENSVKQMAWKLLKDVTIKHEKVQS